MTFSESLRSVAAPPHRAGYPFILAGIAFLVIGLIWAGWLAWLALFLILFCLYFFRDPERVPGPMENAVLAPADGLVTVLDQAAPPPELGLAEEKVWRVGIFLSVLDVHVNRLPVAGVITRIAYRHGAFLNAAADKASELNERNALAMRCESGAEIAVVQIAGLIARRIVCQVHEGDRLAAGARFGIIRFGSRTDLYLPKGVAPIVAIGQRTIGGETVMALLTDPDHAAGGGAA